MPKRVDALKDLTCVDVQCASWYTIVKVLNAPMDVPKVDNDNIADEELQRDYKQEEVDGEFLTKKAIKISMCKCPVYIREVIMGN